MITCEEAIDFIYAPVKNISCLNSDDPLERVYNKKGYKLALNIDDSPAFRLALENFITATMN